MSRLVLLMILMGCGSTVPPKAPVAAPEPFAGTIEVAFADAPLKVRAGGLWSELPQGGSASAVQGLAADGGAILDFSGAQTRGRMWIQAGTRLHVGQDPRGHMTVEIERGAARLQTFDATARDVLLAPNRSPLPTAERPAAADWTTEMQGAPAAGVGTLTPGDAVAQLDLVGLHVRATRNGDLADVEVEHRFYSHADTAIEGTFRFPLPGDAILTGLAMEIGGQLMEGELVEREKARKIYDDIVDQMQDPAILEWAPGNLFKLRVFPIEPQAEKRVVLRYSVPLESTERGWVFRYATAAPAMKQTIGEFTVDLDGERLLQRASFSPGETVTVPVDQPAAAHVVTREGVTYTSLRVTPSWPFGSSDPRPRHIVVFVDTSRSALESQPLARQTVRELVESLRPNESWTLLSGDVVVREHGTDLGALDAIEADGASDLGAAMAALAKQPVPAGHRGEVVYIGDGVATWGAQDADALSDRASALGMPFHTVSLERDAETALLARISGATGGIAVAPRALPDVRRFALRLAATGPHDRLTDVIVEAPEGFEVYPADPVTVFRGDALTLSARGPAALTAVRIRGRRGGAPVVIDIPAQAHADGGRADQRWANHYLARLQREKAEKDLVVKESLRFGVMSRHTAFLVLESEEAYRAHDIERKKAAEARRIAGADLESDGAREASLSHDHIQPGDPEVRVPAPADAKSVWVFFPIGDVHQARWEPRLGMWTTRFLISKETPDGTYWIRVRVTHADGRVEVIKLRYVVDTLKPEVEVRLTRKRGRIRIEARQIVRAGELAREGLPTDAEALRRYAHVAADLRRVDVRLPDGQVLPLRAIATGHFRGTWKPTDALGDWVSLTVVAHDKALNANPRQFTLKPADRGWHIADEGGAR